MHDLDILLKRSEVDWLPQAPVRRQTESQAASVYFGYILLITLTSCSRPAKTAAWKIQQLFSI